MKTRKEKTELQREESESDISLSRGQRQKCDISGTNMNRALNIERNPSSYYNFESTYYSTTTYLQRLFFIYLFFRYKDFTTKHPINAIVKALDPQRSRQKYTYLQN